ncbi:MAG: sel1 repeat family protein [Burkholderiales bacterium]|nr:sel1 repeat family protein [Burkholderiales bacterium]
MPLYLRILALALLPLAIHAADAGKATLNGAFAAYSKGDIKGAAASYRALAASGSHLAQFNYAMMLKRGEVEGDTTPWLPLLEKAAQGGVMNAAYALGIAYEHGEGVARSQNTATRWFRLAAEKGHVDAEVSLATQYFLGRGAPHDEAQAAHWYEKAAEGGDVGAQYIVASMYEHGNGVAVDPARALTWYSAAARQGDPAAKLKAEAIARGH